MIIKKVKVHYYLVKRLSILSRNVNASHPTGRVLTLPTLYAYVAFFRVGPFICSLAVH